VEQYELPHIVATLFFCFIISAHVLGSPRDYSSQVTLQALLTSPGVRLAAHAADANRVFSSSAISLLPLPLPVDMPPPLLGERMDV
jgi:hypothetical protein